MIDQHEPNGTIEGECWWLAQWNDFGDNPQPQYNEANRTWTFPPFTGTVVWHMTSVINHFLSIE